MIFCLSTIPKQGCYYQLLLASHKQKTRKLNVMYFWLIARLARIWVEPRLRTKTWSFWIPVNPQFVVVVVLGISVNPQVVVVVVLELENGWLYVVCSHTSPGIRNRWDLSFFRLHSIRYYYIWYISRRSCSRLNQISFFTWTGLRWSSSPSPSLLQSTALPQQGMDSEWNCFTEYNFIKCKSSWE